MAEWRIGRGWTEAELESQLERLRQADLNFRESEVEDPRVPWRRYATSAVIAVERPGRPRPGGALDRAWSAIRHYHFSDPAIVTAHFDPHDEFIGRTMLLEIRVLGLRYLCGTRITLDRETEDEARTIRGFRYDTLEGHMEKGSEWFLLTQDHRTGEVTFKIEASWLPGEFPNWWSRAGFGLLSEHYQLAWHRLAYLRLRELVGSGSLRLKPVPYGRALVHSGPEVTDSDLWILRTKRPLTKIGALGYGKEEKYLG